MEYVEFREMEYILSVSRERSFSRAAEKNFISQPALSKIVKKVEKNLGIEIFYRGSSPLRLTREGEQLLTYFERLLETEREMRGYCEAVHSSKKKDLVIAAPSFFCSYVLPDLVSDYMEEFPETYIKVVETNDNDLRRLLDMGAVDVGLTVERQWSGDVASFAWAEEMILLAVPAEYEINEGLKKYRMSSEEVKAGKHLLPEQPSVNLSYFSEEKFLFLRQGNDLHSRGMKMCRESGFQPRIVMELDQLLTAYYLASAGQGITFVRSGVPSYVEHSERLYFYKISHPDIFRQIYVVFEKNVRQPDKVEEFLNYMKSRSLLG